jgi:hypothetical protein
MNEILHANIFFFIASTATIFFCIFICFALYQLIKILKSVRRIIERIEAGSEMIARDIAQVRSLVSGGGIFARALEFMTGFKKSPGRTKRRSYKND